jgi:hypothetical protein
MMASMDDNRRLYQAFLKQVTTLKMFLLQLLVAVKRRISFTGILREQGVYYRRAGAGWSVLCTTRPRRS